MTATQKKELLQAVYKRIRTELLSLSIAEIPGIDRLEYDCRGQSFDLRRQVELSKTVSFYIMMGWVLLALLLRMLSFQYNVPLDTGWNATCQD